MNFKNEDVLLQFGKHLKELRNLKKISQEDLAYNSGIALSQIARIETGKINPTLCTIIEIAKKLKVNQAEMLNF